VCCEYIREPLCMDGHKLDMRFFVLLRRSGPQPLAYLSHAFVVRIANLPYGLNNFHEYQRCAPFMARLAASFWATEGPGHPGSLCRTGNHLYCVYLYVRIDVRVI
jgi:hypothetical protein